MTKKMAYLFLLLGLFSLAISIYLFTKKSTPILVESNITSKDNGDAFEDFCIQKIAKDLTGSRFLGKNSDYHKNGVSAEENKSPDLKFSYKNQNFAIECKWRKEFKNEKIEWANNYQIANYKNYATKENAKVYVMIGVGGTSENPEKIYLLPLHRIPYGFATKDFLQEFDYKIETIKK